MLSEHYKMIHIQPLAMSQKEKKTPEGKALCQAILNGEKIAEDKLSHLIHRTDCQTNGWIMEGFPTS